MMASLKVAHIEDKDMVWWIFSCCPIKTWKNRIVTPYWYSTLDIKWHHHQGTAVPGIEALPTWPYTEEFKAILGNLDALLIPLSFLGNILSQENCDKSISCKNCAIFLHSYHFIVAIKMLRLSFRVLKMIKYSKVEFSVSGEGWVTIFLRHKSIQK